MGAMLGNGVKGIAGLLGKGVASAGSALTPAGNGLISAPGAAGEASMVMDMGSRTPGSGGAKDENSEFAKLAKQDRSARKMAESMNAANAIGNPGVSYMDMGGLLGLGARQMDDAQSRAQNLAGNSKAQIYQKMLFDQMMRGG